jgi:ABC-2 type transport system ATP-binding protein
MSSQLIEARALVQGYGPNLILHGLDLSLPAGVTGLLGPNGAGKTTLLRTLATALPPRSGQLRIDNRDATLPKNLESIRRTIGYLPQKFGFPPQFSVAEFVQYSAWLRGVPGGRILEESNRAIELVDLAESAGTKMRKLSGGMRQRAGIAGTIVGGPRIVILDEPTVGLDPMQRISFREVLVDVAERFEAAVLLSTHLVEDIGACCDHVCVLEAGELIYSDKVAAFTETALPGAVGATELERSYTSLLDQHRSVK